MWLVAALLAAQSFDVTTTVVGLNRGCRELLFPSQNAYVIIGAKSTAVALTITLGRQSTFKTATKIAKIGAVAGVVSGVAGGAWNLRQKC